MKLAGWSSWYNTALDFFKKGRFKESKKLLIEINKMSPRYVPALDLLSVVDFKLKNFNEAEKWTLQLLKETTNNSDYANRYAMILLKTDKVRQAGDIIEKGRNYDSKHPGLLYNDIIYHLRTGLTDKAKSLLPQIPQDHPLYEKSKKYIEGFVSSRQVLNKHLEANYQNQNWLGAIETYTQWLEKNIPSSDSYYNLGLLYMKVGNYQMAIKNLSVCYKYHPHYSAAVLLYLWYNKIMICDWLGYEDAAENLTTEVRNYLDTPDPDYDIPIYILSYFDVAQELFPLSGTKIYGRFEKNGIVPPTSEIDTETHVSPRKLRVGYLSSAFYEHPVGRVYQDIFAMHSRDTMEVFVYTTNTIQDQVSQKIADGASIYRNISMMDTCKAYDVISEDKLDILATVGGHGDDMNMELVAMKPASIVINLHGYNESLGGKFADFQLSDREVLPDTSRENFTENIIYFPHCSLINSSLPEPVIKSRRDFNLPEDSFIFLSAAHPRKITPCIFKLWQEILLRTQNTVLWIWDYGIPEVEQNLRKYLEEEELNPRIFFSGRLPYKEHLGRYHLADLLLDTPLYNCHSIGIEALRCGLPFITLQGINANSRFGGSMLKTIGLPELVCYSDTEYVEKAINFSKQLHSKTTIHKSNPLFDTKRNVGLLEKGYKDVLKRYKENKPFVDVLLDYD